MALAPPRAVVSGSPRDPTFLWRVLRVCVIGAMAVTLAQGAVDFFDLVASPDGTASILEAVWLNAYLYAAQAAWIVFFLTFFFLLWPTYRLARNLHMLAPRKFSMSPTYAIGWYVVPLANLFMPPRVLGIIARHTFAVTGETKNHNVIIGWWWATFLTTALLGNVATIVANDSGAFDPGLPFDATAYEASLWINLMASGTNLVASICMLGVFGPLARAQATLVRAWRDESPQEAAR